MAPQNAHTASGSDDRPQLELSGPILATALETMINSCEANGGIERYVSALKLKSSIFQQSFEKKTASTINADDFTRLTSLMPTVRRRIGIWLEDEKYPELVKAVDCLFGEDPVDVRLAQLCSYFPEDKRHRWVRDLGAEILHNVEPEKYPLMNRWIWDHKANTGVIREIWHGTNVDHMTLPVADGFETYLVLREELSQYLTANGIYQDVLSYVDLLCAHIYSEYIAAQGGSYLKADFSAAEDPTKHMRRLLGLDGVRAKTNRKLPASIEGNAELVEQANLLTGDTQ
ncbi:MAG: hypothetical protein ACWA5L_06210 [bacterium]